MHRDNIHIPYKGCTWDYMWLCDLACLRYVAYLTSEYVPVWIHLTASFIGMKTDTNVCDLLNVNYALVCACLNH